LLALTGGSAWAADHRDGPGVRNDPAADINDVYTFVSPENPNKVIVIMTVFPLADANATFSDAVEYRFNIQQIADGNTRRDFVCTFQAGGAYTCAGPSGVSASGTVGGGTAMGDSIRAWAGLRDDPFFFDLNGFLKVVGKNDAADPLCLVQGDNTGTDFFAGLNTLAIVLEIDRTVLWANQENPQLRIWGSTARIGEGG
jgi:hypothetical protein